jgi:4,5-DOPA dioxygenase extradiol
MLPSLYISHGSPALMIMNNNTTKILKELSSKFDKPKYILVISAHWVTNDLKILYKESPSTIYDFYNFPKELYELSYEAKSDLRKSDEITNLLKSNGFEVGKDSLRGGFDHGVWSPLSFLYPKADVPVVQLSLPLSYDSKRLFDLGEVLKKLREDTLIIASGSMTHNLADINWDENSTTVKSYAKEFRDWIVNKIEIGDINSLINYKIKAPYLRQNHPSEEHFLPLLVALGSSTNHIGESLHNEFMYGNLSMDTIIFKG